MGRRLAEVSGLPLFHNHLAIDAVTSVFRFGSDPFTAVLHRFRLDVFETAASAGRSLIFTNNSVWSGPNGRRRFLDFADEADRRVRVAGGLTLFVRLAAPITALEGRLRNDDRRALGKLTDVRLLHELVDDYDLSPLHVTDVQFDTAKTHPDAAVEAILASVPGQQRADNEGTTGSA